MYIDDEMTQSLILKVTPFIKNRVYKDIISHYGQRINNKKWKLELVDVGEPLGFFEGEEIFKIKVTVDDSELAHILKFKYDIQNFVTVDIKSPKNNGVLVNSYNENKKIMNEMAEWCMANCSKRVWLIDRNNKILVSFQDSSDAVKFKLRWY